MFKTALEKKTLLLLGIFILALATANLLGAKVTTIFGVSVSVGIFTYPFTFVVTDIVEEVLGKETSKHFLKIGLICMILMFLLTALFVALPAASRFADQVDSYNTVFKFSLRMTFASIVAFGISQLHDIWAFEFWKKKTKGRFLWLRNNLSTMISQALDTLIFMYLAMYHLTPKFTAGYVFQLALTYWLCKILFAALDTPIVYAGVRWLKKGSGLKELDKNEEVK